MAEPGRTPGTRSHSHTVGGRMRSESHYFQRIVVIPALANQRITRDKCGYRA